VVLSPLVQQFQQRPASTQTGVEELNFFVEGIRLQVIAEIAAVQRVLERTHPIPCRVDNPDRIRLTTTHLPLACRTDQPELGCCRRGKFRDGCVLLTGLAL
jgi:hypothetical protein